MQQTLTSLNEDENNFLKALEDLQVYYKVLSIQ